MSTELINYFSSQAWLMFLHASSKYVVLKDGGSEKPIPNYLFLDALSTSLSPSNVHSVNGKYSADNVLSEMLVDNDSSSDKKLKIDFFNMTTDKLSYLVPELRFYKAIENELIPFYFPIAAVPSSQGTSGIFSTLGASGVQNFSVSYTGTDPFTAPRYLEADLSIYVDNIANIFQQPPESGYATLADLFTISLPADAAAIQDSTGGSAVAPSDLSRPIEIVATLGYAVPKPSSDVSFTFGEIDDIISSNLALRMNVFHHQINLEQDGSATIDIKYTARIDNLTRDKMYNVADSPVEILMRADIRQIFSNSSKSKKSDPTAEKRGQVEKALEMSKILEHADQKGMIKSVFTTEALLREFTTFGATIDEQLYQQIQGDFSIELGGQALMGTADEFDPLATEMASILGSLVKTKGAPPAAPKVSSNSGAAGFSANYNNFRSRVKELDTSNRPVHYILFGDLVQCFIKKTGESLEEALWIVANSRAMNRVYAKDKEAFSPTQTKYLKAFSEKDDKEKEQIVKQLRQSLEKLATFRVLLTNIEYKVKTPADSNSKATKKIINIANIPISLALWQSFAWKKISSTWMNSYTLPQFLEDCMNTLLPSALSDFISGPGGAPNIVDSSPHFTSSTFTGPELKSFLKKRGNLDISDVPSPLKSFTATSVLEECDYLVIHQSQDRETSSPGDGIEANDMERGIFHFHLGKNRGLIKDISFSRFEVPFAQEQLMTNQVGKYDELKMPYQASISMFGNNLFFPGSQIFIDPSTIGFGSSLDVTSPAFRLGLGGYYTVLSVTTSVSDGEIETSLECSFGSHASFNTQASNIDTSDSPIMAQAVGEAFLQVKSKDSEPDLSNPASRFGPNVDDTESVIYMGLMNLTTDSGDKVLDPATAQRIAANHHSGATLRIPGVVEETIDPSTGRTTLKLANGMIVKIDPANGSNPVSLVYEPQEIRSRYDSRRPPPPTGMEGAILRRVSEKQLNQKMRDQGLSSHRTEEEIDEALREIYDPANNSQNQEE